MGSFVRSFRIIKTRSAALLSPLLAPSSRPPLSLSLLFSHSLRLSHFLRPSRFCPLFSFLFLLTYRRIVLPLSFLFNKCLFLPSAIFFFFYFFFFSSSASSSSFSLSSSSSLLRAFYVRFSLVPRYLASSSARSVSGPSVHPFPFHPISPVFSRVLSLSLACSLFLTLSLSLLRSRCSFPSPDCPSSVSFFSLRALFLSPPRPIARSAGIRGIFEPVHDGRLLQGRTFLQHTPKSFERRDQFGK